MPDCLSSYNVHVAIDSDNNVRIGGTDTLNTQAALSKTFGFHPASSPFSMTHVLTTYAKITSSTPNCTLTTTYDDKIPPMNGYHVGAVSVSAGADCAAGSCINLEFLQTSHNPNGVCRIEYNARCASNPLPAWYTASSPPPPLA